jgi:hypothetical protein
MILLVEADPVVRKSSVLFRPELQGVLITDRPFPFLFSGVFEVAGRAGRIRIGFGNLYLFNE